MWTKADTWKSIITTVTEPQIDSAQDDLHWGFVFGDLQHPHTYVRLV